MLHRAVLGSLERFLGILIESTAGYLPLWLSPHPVTVATITNAVDGYAKEVVDLLKDAGIYAELDDRNEKISYKVREPSKAKGPVIFVIGEQEANERTVAIRRLGSQATEVIALDEALAILKEQTAMPI
jgi:threonyl-tRNA synthetase